MSTGQHAFDDCHVRWGDGELVLGNDVIERRWNLAGGLPVATSLIDRRTGREWIARPAATGTPRPAGWTDGPCRLTVTAQAGCETVPEARSLIVDLAIAGPAGDLALRLQVWPGLPAVSSRITAWSGNLTSTTAADTTSASGIELAEQKQAAARDDLIERFDLSGTHLRLTAVELRDRTDIEDELVAEHEWLLHPNQADLRLRGNLFAIEDVLTGDALVCVKEAPLPAIRPVPCDADLRLSGTPACYYAKQPADQFDHRHPAWPLAYALSLHGHGLGRDEDAADQADEAVPAGYRHTILIARGGQAGRTMALHHWSRRLRPPHPARDGLLLSNTWGDRSRDARVCEDFVSAEIAAGARLGVDVVQIDDGWQAGTTSNSVDAKAKGGVWEGFRSAGDFWAPHPQRFPRGLAPVAAAAEAAGLRLGLWFAPDSADDFAHWREDAATVLDLHRRWRVGHVKIDGVKIRSRRGERNLHRFFRRVLRESGGAVTFDLDVTAESRPGYLGLVSAGPVFVENRYSDFHRWWPHHTLRNLWTLARWLDPQRLRMEFLNPQRNTALYANDPLAPSAWPPAALFAAVMASSPLAWCEVSNLPPAVARDLAPLIAVWRRHRDAFQAGTLLPIGETPDGTAWTGFCSCGGDTGAYLLLIRELNDRSDCLWRLDGPLADLGGSVEILAGDGTLTVHAGRVVAAIPRPLGFLFARLV